MAHVLLMAPIGFVTRCTRHTVLSALADVPTSPKLRSRVSRVHTLCTVTLAVYPRVLCDIRLSFLGFDIALRCNCERVVMLLSISMRNIYIRIN